MFIASLDRIEMRLIFDFFRGQTAELHALYWDRKEFKNIEKFYANIKLTEEIKQIPSGSIIECFFDKPEWIFMRQREDRDHPNGLRTIQGLFRLIYANYEHSD